MCKKKAPILRAVVAPKQKKVKIMLGKKVLKEYNFKMDIPSKKITRAVFVHDYTVWSVADRDSISFQEDVAWDEETIKAIQIKALDYYKKKENRG